MKKAIRLLIVCALFFSLLILPSCSFGKSDGTLTVKLPKEIIYADADGVLYYVNVDNTQYLHLIGARYSDHSYSYPYNYSEYYDVNADSATTDADVYAVHSFTKNPPKTISGYTVRIVPNTPVGPDVIPTTPKDPPDPFETYTEASGDIVPAEKRLIIFDKETIYNAMENETAFSAAFGRSLDTVNWEDWRGLLLETDAVDATCMIGDEEYRVIIELKTFTYKETVKETYVFASDYAIKKTPYYDTETGKLAAQRVTVTPVVGSSLTYFEYE
ncbi:MAG: hypothetical protein IK090_00820 [Clostridia bacterium]|nr:hypothetical protein [Clostridia bacterium]